MAVPARIGVGSGRTDVAGRTDGIELRGLAKSYRSGDTVIPAVRGVDVAIAPGETVALLGPNGAGKSTTIDMLLGLPEPDAGTVSVFGQEPPRGGRGRRASARCSRPARSSATSPSASCGDDGARSSLARSTSTRCSSSPGSPSSPASARRSSRAGRRSASASRSRSSATRSCSSSTSRPWRWTSRAATRSGRRCATSPPRGKTVLFATHYLEEADAYADRIVLMAHGAHRRRRPADRDQGDGRLPDDPRDAARRRRSRRSSGCPA